MSTVTFNCQLDKCEQKLKSLYYEELRELQKSRTKKSEVSRKKEQSFLSELELFDIAVQMLWK